MVISVPLALPHFFEFKVVEDPETGLLHLEETAMRNAYTYTTVYSGFTLVFMVIVPLVVLVFTNVKIVWVLKTSACKNLEKSFAWTTIIIVIIFILCNSFKFVNNMFSYFETIENEIVLSVIYMIAKISLVVNCSINFVVYCFVGGKFKSALLRKICCQDPKRKLSDNNIFIMSRDSNGTFIRHPELKRNNNT